MSSAPAITSPRPPTRLAASPRVQRWIASMVDAVPTPLLLVTVEGRLLNANAAGRRVLQQAIVLAFAVGRVVPAGVADAAAFAEALRLAACSGRRQVCQGGRVWVVPVDVPEGTDCRVPLLMLSLTGTARMARRRQGK